MTKRPRSSMTPDQYLEQFPSAIREAGEKARSLVLDALPGVVERYYPGWNLIGYRIPDGKATRYCCYICAYPKYVELGFEWGILLDDPDGIFEGEGSQVRKIVFRAAKDVKPVTVRRLLLAAALITKEKLR